MPRVSVVIPTYKRAALIGNAIASVLDQTFQDFEILIVDDASPDDTEEAVLRFRDSRIRYLRQAVNQGDAAARNAAIRMSCGEFIAFLDDDDEWLPEKLRLQTEFLSTSGPDVAGVHTARFVVDRWRRTERIICLSGAERGPLPGVATSTMMLRRACFDTMGMFDETLPTCSDYDMWLRVSAVHTLGYITQPLVRYYVHEESLSHNYSAMCQGEAFLLTKYVDRYSPYPDILCRRYLQLGGWYCNAGDVTRARGAFLQAARWNPREMRSYFNFALSLLGARGFGKAQALKERLRKMGRG